MIFESIMIKTTAHKMLLHPQEIETFYILPTLRRYIALGLKQRGMKQKDIAQMLGISSASISQYTSTKRGHQIQFPDQIVQEIKKAVAVIKDRYTYFQQTQHLLHIIREQKVLCQIHSQFSYVPEKCDPLIMGCHRKKMATVFI
jgi:predicted transcriptional regulator